MRTQDELIRTLRRRVDFLKTRDHRNSYDQAELGALEWALVNLPPPQRTWVNMTEEEVDQGLLRTNYAMQTAKAWRDGVDWAIKQLQERNT